MCPEISFLIPETQTMRGIRFVSVYALIMTVSHITLAAFLSHLIDLLEQIGLSYNRGYITSDIVSSTFRFQSPPAMPPIGFRA